MTRRWSALGVLALGVLLIGVDGTVLAVAAPFIIRDLDPTATQVLWIGDIYSFILAGLLVTMGALGDRVGHKKLLLGGATGFAIMSIATAYAPTAGLLIGARVLLAVAGATLAPSTLALIRGVFPDPRERSVAVGIWAAVFSAGTALGPVVGGVLLEHFWWGSVFLINVPVIIVIIAGGVLLPDLRNPIPGPWDMPSVGLSLVGMFGVVYAIKEAIHSGLEAETVAAGLIGVAAFALFVRRQLRLADPLIDIRLFCDTTFSAVVVANLLSVLGLSGVVFFLSQYFQLVTGYSPLQAGLAELPAAVAATVSGVLAGLAVRIWSRRVVLATGLALIGLAMASLTTITSSTGYPRIGVALFVVGVGLGLAYAVANDLILDSVPAERSGAAAAVSETAYELGMALGIALLGSIVAAVYRGLRIPPGVEDDVATYARETLGAAHQAATTLPTENAHALLRAAQSAFTDGLTVAAGAGSVLLLASAATIWVLLKSQSPGMCPPRAKVRTPFTPRGN